MNKLKAMSDCFTLPSILIGAVILWVPVMFLLLALFPNKRSKFAMKEIRKLVKAFKTEGKPQDK